MTTSTGSIAFAPRARLLKLIGAELISDDVVAITELVKNAHDADATRVTISFRRVTGPDGEIVVTDDGHGMDLDALLEQWMQPASSLKGSRGRRHSRTGRRMLGEKGVGRFATDKIARHLELISRTKRPAREIRAEFDWDRFEDSAAMLSDIEHRWHLRKPEVLRQPGTILRMRDLRTPWTERLFRRLTLRLSRLLSPFQRDNGFSIRIESDEFPDYAGNLRSDILQRSPYRIVAEFDGADSVHVVLDGKRKIHHLWNGTGDLRCGPVRVQLHAYDLETEAISAIGPRMEVRAWLREWSGVSVYRDGFRVWPYGEPHDDWLRLDQRRVNNPTVKLSNNQIVGFVEIARDGNPDLRDQTNREGLIHNRALDDLRRLVFFVLQNLEAERQRVRHPEAGPVRSNSATRRLEESLPEAISRLASKANGTLASELHALAKNSRKSLEAKSASFEYQLQEYAHLALLGQAAAGAGSVIEARLGQLLDEHERIRTWLDGKRPRPVTRALTGMKAAVDQIQSWTNLVSGIEAGQGYRRRAIDMASEVARFFELISPVIEEHGVTLELPAPSTAVARVEFPPDAFGRVLLALTRNALEWTEGVRHPRIRIRVKKSGRLGTLEFSDNGPGVDPELAEQIFQPLYSGREDGAGLGLSLARDTVEAHGGTIALLTDGRRKGANFRIDLPLKGRSRRRAIAGSAREVPRARRQARIRR